MGKASKVTWAKVFVKLKNLQIRLKHSSRLLTKHKDAQLLFCRRKRLEDKDLLLAFQLNLVPWQQTCISVSECLQPLKKLWWFCLNNKIKTSSHFSTSRWLHYDIEMRDITVKRYTVLNPATFIPIHQDVEEHNCVSCSFPLNYWVQATKLAH